MLSIADYLACGHENAKGLRELMRITGMNNRTVRRMIELERRAGCPILSDNINGYYLPESEEEVERCVLSMRHRAQEICRTADAIERAKL